MGAETTLAVLIGKEPVSEFASIYQFYEFPDNEEKIISFIKEYPFLLSILLEAPREVKRIFGENVSLGLELHHDPEADFEELFIVIKSTYSAEKAREFMDKLGEGWFLNLIELTHNKLSITEEPL